MVSMGTYNGASITGGSIATGFTGSGGTISGGTYSNSGITGITSGFRVTEGANSVFAINNGTV